MNHFSTDLFYHVGMRTYGSVPRVREKETDKDGQEWHRERDFVKNKVCFASSSLLYKGNLHMNMPAQLCCHLLGKNPSVL